MGPHKNCRNVPVLALTTWEKGYKDLFFNHALPFLYDPVLPSPPCQHTRLCTCLAPVARASERHTGTWKAAPIGCRHAGPPKEVSSRAERVRLCANRSGPEGAGPFLFSPPPEDPPSTHHPIHWAVTLCHPVTLQAEPSTRSRSTRPIPRPIIKGVPSPLPPGILNGGSRPSGGTGAGGNFRPNLVTFGPGKTSLRKSAPPPWICQSLIIARPIPLAVAEFPAGRH